MDTKQVKEKYEETLLTLKGVTGIGLNGSIIVYVEELTPQLKGLIPKALDGVNIKIIETGKISLLSMGVPMMSAIYPDRISRYRPAFGGISCGHTEVTAGTLTCRAIDKETGKFVGLSNNHVCALNWGSTSIGKKGDSILQPAPHDGGVESNDKIGELERWIPVELEKDSVIDGAIFKSDVLGYNIHEVGILDSVKEPTVGMGVLKSGRTSGVTYSKVIDVDATILVDGGDWGECTFKDQVIAMPGFIYPGDSGSWVGEIDTFRSVGLGFAGSPVLSVLNKMSNVEELLNIAVLPPILTVNPWSMTIPLGVVSLVGGIIYGGKK